MANRKKLVPRKNHGGYKKDKRTKKNEENVLCTEVQRYKDREKEAQLEDGPSVSNRRLSMHQGMYNHGRTSGKVQRDFGLSKEAKARAEANLTRILELASSNASEDSQHRKPNVTSSSSKNSSTEIIEPSQDMEVKDRVEEVEEKKTCPSSEEDMQEEEDLKNALCERLLIAARHGFDKKSKQLPGHGKMLKSLLNELKSQVQNRSGPGFSRHSPCGITRKLLRLQESNRLSSRLSTDIPKDARENLLNPKKSIDVTPELNSFAEEEATVLKTPQSKDFLKLDVEIDSEAKKSEQHSLHLSLLDSTCSSTNIMSPRSLLIRYEENLKGTNDTSHSCHSLIEVKGNHGFGVDNLRKQKRACDVSEICDANKNVVSKIVGRKNYRIDDENTQIFTNSHSDSVNVLKPEMEKSVVVNPLDYIERYEQQTSTRQREDIDLYGGAVDCRTGLTVSNSNYPASANETCPNETMVIKSHGSGVINSAEAMVMWPKHEDPRNKIINHVGNMYAGDPGCETVDITSSQSHCRCHTVRTSLHSDTCDMGLLDNSCSVVCYPGTSVCASYNSADRLLSPGQPHYSSKQNALPCRIENPNLHSSKLSVNHISQQISKENDLVFPLSQRTSDLQVCISDQQHSKPFGGSDVYGIKQQTHSNIPFERTTYGASDTQLMLESKRYQAPCGNDSLEELSKDFVFPPHRTEYSSFYSLSAKDARRSKEPWEDQFESVARSYGGDTSGYINALNSTSQSSTQNSPIDTLGIFLNRQPCFRSYGKKRSLVNNIENCGSWQLPGPSQPFSSQVEMFEQPLQYGDHRFYDRKLH